jgi:hypothetical protein
MGCYQGGSNPNQLAIAVNGNLTYFCPNNINDTKIQISTNSQGFFLTSRRSSTDILGQRNSTQYFESLSESRNNTKIFIGAVNFGGASFFSTKETAFNSIGDGLTDYEAKALYWIVQKYQTTLGRQVY